MLQKILKFVLRHKIATGLIASAIVAGGYFGYQELTKDKNTVQYATAAVEKGALIVSISGSGQVSASDQLDIKSKVKGEIEAIYVKSGEEVETGKTIAKIDDTDFQKAVSDAKISLETAKLELEELLSPPDELTLLRSENSVSQAKNSLEKLKLEQEKEYQEALKAIQEAEENIERAYEDTLNSVTDVFWDLPTIIIKTRDVLYSYEISKSETTLSEQENVSVYLNLFAGEDRDDLYLFIENAQGSYKQAKENYDRNFENYKKVSYYSEKEVIEALLNETTETTKSTAQTVKDETNLIGLVVDYLSTHNRRIYKKITDYQSDLKTYTSKVNSHYSGLLSIQRSLQDNREAKLKAEENLAKMKKTHPLDLEAAEISLREKEKSLAELKAGADELDIRAKENSIRQREDALLAAEKDVANCYIYVPFNGTIADIKIKKGDSVSSGTTLANIITKQKIAEISLNEIDAAAVKVDQKATLTFDALPDLTISGKVLEVDVAGEASQGVVSYGVKIGFDTEDERIKPGMSVAVDIITNVKQDVLILPNSAIKSRGDSRYVELVEVPEEMKQQLLNNKSGTVLPQAPKSQTVEIGLSNDTSTEIVSGLKEGDIVVTSTTTTTNPNNTQTTTKTQNGQGFRAPGGEVQMFFR